MDVGSTVVLQTAGRSGSFNPHLHILCTSGGMTKDGRFKEFGFIDFDLLHTKWQYHLLEMLRDNVKSKEIKEKIDRCWRDYPNGLVAYIEKGDVPKGGKGLARYLAKYVVSPPIFLQRIRYYGLHATSRASRTREELKDLLNDISESITGTYRVTGYRDRIKKNFGVDPLLCPKCGSEMEFEGIWHPGHGWIVDNRDSFFAEEIRGYVNG